MTTEAIQTCKKLMGINGYHVRSCGKNVKGQTDAGEWLCGIHLGAYNRVKKNRAAEQARQDNNNEVRGRHQPNTSRVDRTVRAGRQGLFFVQRNLHRPNIGRRGATSGHPKHAIYPVRSRCNTHHQLTEASKWYRHHRNP